jgi:hypothetical protein
MKLFPVTRLELMFSCEKIQTVTKNDYSPTNWSRVFRPRSTRQNETFFLLIQYTIIIAFWCLLNIQSANCHTEFLDKDAKFVNIGNVLNHSLKFYKKKSSFVHLINYTDYSFLSQSTVK